MSGTSTLTASLRLSLDDKLSPGLAKLSALFDKLARLAKGLSFDNLGRGAASLDRATKAASGLSGMLGGVLRGADRAAGALGRMGAAAVRAGKAAGGRAAEFGRNVGAVGTAVEGYSLYKPIEAFADFDAKIRAIVVQQGLSGDAALKAAAMWKSVISADALKSGQTSESIAEGAIDLLRKGLTQAETREALPVHSEASTAYDTKTEIFGSIVAAITKTFQIPLDQLGASVSAVAYAGQHGNFKVPDFATYLPGQASLLKGLGYSGRKSLDMALAMVETIARQNPEPSTADAAFREMITHLTSAHTNNLFKKRLHIDLPEVLKKAAAQGIDPITAFLGKLDQITKGKTPLEQQEILSTVLTQIGQSAGARALLQEHGFYVDELKGISSADPGTLQRDFDEKAAGPAFGVAQSKEGAVQIERNLGEGFTPMLAVITAVERAVLWLFDTMDERLPGSREAVLGLLGGFLLLGAALGAIGFIAPAVMAGFTLVSGPILWLLRITGLLSRLGVMWTGLRLILINVGEAIVAMTGVSLGGIALIAVAIAGAAYLIYRYWTPIKAFFGMLWRGIRDGWEAAWTWIEATPVGRWAASFANLMAAGWRNMIASITAAWRDFTDWFRDTFPALTGLVDRIAEHQEEARKRAWSAATASGGNGQMFGIDGLPGLSMDGEITVRAAPGAEVVDTKSSGPVKLKPAPSGTGDTLSRQRR